MPEKDISPSSAPLRPIGEVLARDPLSPALVLLHETSNMIQSIQTAAPNTLRFQTLLEQDQERNAVERERFLDELQISPLTRHDITKHLEMTGGFEQPIMERMIAAGPSRLRPSTAPWIRGEREGFATFEEARNRVFYEAISAAEVFSEVVKCLQLSEEPKVSHYFEDWQERLRGQQTLMLAQESQIVFGESPSPQIELMQKGQSEIMELIGRLMNVFESDATVFDNDEL